VTDAELIALVCCDLGAIVRGRSVFASDLPEHLRSGVGWVPANHALTPLGGLAAGSPFGSTGDLRLMPDEATRARVDPDVGASAMELLLCDIVELDGTPWACCSRSFLREAVARLERELEVEVHASFEHEFQLGSDEPTALPFSLDAQRRVDPFPVRVMAALAQAGTRPERFFAEFADHQFEIPVAATTALASADRAVVFREVVREVARRHGTRATFVPLGDPDGAGNGVHIHLSLVRPDGGGALYDAGRDGRLSELGGRFAAGILLHARALSALTAPSPVSQARLQPHRWSAGAVSLGERNRETLLRIPPIVSAGGQGEPGQLRLEYRGADASANPHLVLAGVLLAGLDGVLRELPAPEILRGDPSALGSADAERHRVGGLPATLEEAMRALADDESARGWLPPLLYDAYVSLKGTEIAAAAGLQLREVCERYVAIY
jgi:glutamine synthetase